MPALLEAGHGAVALVRDADRYDAPTTLPTAIVVGAGSASFELAWGMVERPPVAISPRWVHTPCQPIAVDGAIAHLADVLDVLSDEAIMRRVAREVREREPVILPVAVLTPRLCSCWVGLVSDVPERVRRAGVGQ